MSKKETLPVTEEENSGEGKLEHGHHHGKRRQAAAELRRKNGFF